jgi:predicted naringenin-chalcone synthase
VSTIVGLGLALPQHRLAADDGRAVIARHWPHLTAVAVEPVTRYLVRPIEEVFGPHTITERMTIYAQEAPRLARAAATRALAEAGVGPADVDLVISVSCTGYMVPALDVQLANEMGFKPSALRLPLTELGCSGGATALATAHRHLNAEPHAVVLVVCVELCSLTFDPSDLSVDNLTASLVFGDGAAAAVLRSEGHGLQICRAGSRLVPDSSHLLGFQLTDGGFHPILDRHLPRQLEAHLPELVGGFCDQAFEFYAVHAGGPRIFDAVERALLIPAMGLQASRRCFQEVGNLSSASLLFVLAQLGQQAGVGLALAFGPGLCVELLELRAPGG